MGIAAYNRGSALLSRQIDAEQPGLDDLFLRELTELSLREATDFLFAVPTVIRLDGGKVYLMNKQSSGWSSSCQEFAGLRDVARAYQLVFVGTGRDKHSSYVEVHPVPRPDIFRPGISHFHRIGG
jgi:hypothetical protein